jgi:hypothetical protein
MSACLVNVHTTDPVGTLQCETGSGSIEVSLSMGIYLTGDLLPNRCVGGANAGGRCATTAEASDCPEGICLPDPSPQPCPICNPGTLTCNGGARNGERCIPGSDATGSDQLPTSHDCPVSELVRLGELEVTLRLSTEGPNHAAGPSGRQQRVFCGFCRHMNTGGFALPAVPCQSNADCAPPFESCEQRSQGAFRSGVATAIALAGVAAGPLTDLDVHHATLASVFCVPPVDNGLIDALADLPGPAALALRGTLQLLPDL